MTPNPIDVHVGARVRLRRTLLGLTQEKLGDAVRLAFQQIQKYERGRNRIGSSRLYQFSQILDVPVSFFFDDMPPLDGRALPGLDMPDANRLRAEASGGAPERDPLVRRETLELVRAYYRIDDPAARKRLFELTKAIANMGAGGGTDTDRVIDPRTTTHQPLAAD